MANFGWTGGDLGQVPTSSTGSGSSSNGPSQAPKKVNKRRQKLNDYVILMVAVIVLGAAVALAVVLT